LPAQIKRNLEKCNPQEKMIQLINISKKSLSLSFILNVYYLLFWKHHSECIVIHIFGIVVMRDWYLAATFLIAI
jgi:hypothetical protein